MLNEKDLMKNGSGYYDPTAYEAIKNIETEEERLVRLELEEQERYQKLVGCILRICELSNFHLEERLVLKSNRTGRVWR